MFEVGGGVRTQDALPQGYEPPASWARHLDLVRSVLVHADSKPQHASLSEGLYLDGCAVNPGIDNFIVTDCIDEVPPYAIYHIPYTIYHIYHTPYTIYPEPLPTENATTRIIFTWKWPKLGPNSGPDWSIRFFFLDRLW